MTSRILVGCWKLKKLEMPENFLRPLLDTDYLSELEAAWGRPWGAQSNIDKLRMVMVGGSRGSEEFWESVALARAEMDMSVDVAKKREQHEGLVKVLRDEGIEVVYLEPKPPYMSAYGANLAFQLCYGRWSLVINGGAIVCRNGYAISRGITAFFAKRIMELGCPILYTVHGKGVLEASNFVWLDPKRVAIGIGLRANMEGVKQIRPILERAGVEEIILVHMPGNLYTTEYRGPAVGGPSGCFHLDMTLGVADENLVVVYPGLVDYQFVNYLLSKGIDLIEVPEKEIHTCGPNILALEPGKVIIPAGNDETSRALREKGVDVIEVEISEFLPWGGPTCMTLPLIRKA